MLYRSVILKFILDKVSKTGVRFLMPCQSDEVTGIHYHLYSDVVCLFKTGFHYVALAGLELTVLARLA